MRPQRYNLEKILSEETDYQDSEIDDSNSFSLAKPSSEDIEKIEEPQSIPSTKVDTIWSVSQSVSQNYDASIYQIMWGPT